MNLRLATLTDLPILVGMMRSYLREQQAEGCTVRFTTRSLDAYRDLARRYLSGQLDGVIVVAEEASRVGEVVALAMAGEPGVPPMLDNTLGRQANVWLVWVDPAYRKTGLALSMLSWGRPYLVGMGFETATMTVREGNDLGERLTLAYGAAPSERMYHFRLEEEPRHGRKQQQG